MDDCVSGHHDCPSNAKCSNSPGAFHCICDIGYEDVDFADPLLCEGLLTVRLSRKKCSGVLISITTRT